MHLTLIYPGGLTVEAVVLSANTQNMRVALKGGRDAVELRKIDDGWVTDNDEPVEIAGILAGSEEDTARLCEPFAARTLSAR